MTTPRKTPPQADVSYMPFYPSFRETIALFPESERLQAYEMIIDYGLYGTEPGALEDIPLHMATLFLAAKPIIDRAKLNAVNGRKGGRPAAGSDQEETPSAPKTTPKKEAAKKSKKQKTDGLTDGLTSGSRKEKEKEKEKEKDIYLSSTSLLPLQGSPDGAPTAPADAAGARPGSPAEADQEEDRDRRIGYTMDQVEEAAHMIGSQLQPDQLKDFFRWMEKYSWTINGQPVNLQNALRGYERKHAPQTAARIEKQAEKDREREERARKREEVRERIRAAQEAEERAEAERIQEEKRRKEEAAQEARKRKKRLSDLLNGPMPKNVGEIPEAYRDQLQAAGIGARELWAVAVSRDYFPESEPIKNYPADFMEQYALAMSDRIAQEIAAARNMEP